MSVPKYPLLKNVHSYLKHPSNEDVYLTKYNYYYHHYICDGFNDVGWGCGYRTLQSICSMIIMTNEIEVSVPSIKQIQEILCKIGDKETSFMNSREWTGAIETCYVIDELFNIPSYLHHISNSERISTKRNEIVNYFRDHGGVIAMGGDQDAASKLIAGVSVSKDEELSLLVVKFQKVPKI
ncbi:CLUMA_CG011611, isoform A [Clunio marinus]|uniref:CLUMA_CG011611, isoform A n=1 Tax=Clunio marinus TaxID=568069 RepID=A0A1J1IIG3_9DIPT|nr:CLUMA_CG011611, isoform A [Clunio marinus]